jgi:hypothetical protein
VFTNFNGRVDCSVLTYSGEYADAQHMGIQNDAITYVDPGPPIPLAPGQCLFGGQYGLY